jgi:hypothetical protein
MANKFTVRLMSLRCVMAQEEEGDEVLIFANGSLLWSPGGAQMIEVPALKHHVVEFDFANRRKLTVNGWVPFEDFDSTTTSLEDQSEPVIIQLRERDMLLGDDVLGEVNVSTANKGTTRHNLNAEGAQYELTLYVG